MKKLFALVLAIVMALMAGCSSNANSNVQSTNTTDNSSTSAVSEVEDKKEEDMTSVYGPYANENYDFNGMKFIFFYPWDRTPQKGTSDDVDRFLERIEYFEKKWNFTVEWVEVGWDNYIERYITTTMAGDPLGHFGYIISRDLYPSFISAGLAYPLSDLGVFDKYSDEYPELLMKDSASLDGKTYAVAENFTSSSGGAETNGTGVFFNTSLFDREGLESPYELYKNGEWTWDKMIELAKAATKDTDGDGEIDQWGLTGRYVPQAFVYSNGGETLKESNGEFKFGLLEDVAIEALDYYAKVRALPIWTGFDSWDQPMKAFAEGNIAMNINQWWTANSYYKDMTDDWGWVPMPVGPSANGNEALFGDETSYLWMPSCYDETEAKNAAIIYEAITKDPASTDDDWIYNTENLVRDRNTIEMIQMALDTYPTKLDLFKGFGLESVINTAIGTITNGEQTARSAMQSIEQQVYASINDSMNADIAGRAEVSLALAALVKPTDYTVEGAITEENKAEVQKLIDNVEAAIQKALAAGHTQEEIEKYSGYENYKKVKEALEALK